MGTSMWGWQMKELWQRSFYCPMEDPDYQVIEGAWLNEEPYGVVHRITSDGTVKGAASACLTWAFGQCGNLKIDTHRTMW